MNYFLKFIKKRFKNSHLPFLAAKWSGVNKNLPKVNKNQIHIFSITIFSCKMKLSILKSSILHNATFLLAAKHGHSLQFGRSCQRYNTLWKSTMVCKTGQRVATADFYIPLTLSNLLLYCKIWLLPPLELVKISFYKV